MLVVSIRFRWNIKHAYDSHASHIQERIESIQHNADLLRVSHWIWREDIFILKSTRHRRGAF